MRPYPPMVFYWLCALLLSTIGTAALAQAGCSSLSGCPYQAGRVDHTGRDARRAARFPALQDRPPVMLNSCDAGGCAGPDITRYNGSPTGTEGGVYLDPAGRRCVRSGEWMQCG